MSMFSDLYIYRILLIASAWVEGSVKSSRPVTLYKVAVTHHVYCRFCFTVTPCPEIWLKKRSSEWSYQLPRDVRKKIHVIVWNQIHGRTTQNLRFIHQLSNFSKWHTFKVDDCFLVFLTLQDFVGNLDTNSGWPSFQHKTPWNHVIQQHVQKAQCLSTKSRASHKGSRFERGCIMARILVALLQLGLAKRLKCYQVGKVNDFS